MISFPAIKFYESEEKLVSGGNAADYSALMIELINATTEKKASPLAQRFAFDFLSRSPCSEWKITAEDVLSARAVFALALSLRGLLDNNDCSVESIESLGFEAEYFNDCFDSKKDIDLQLLAPKLWEKYAKDCAAEKGTASQVRFSFRFDIKAGAYLNFLNWSIDSTQPGLEINELASICSGLPDTSSFFTLTSPCTPISEEGQREQVKQMIDELFSLHLFDVRTTSIDGGHELRTCGSVLSSIWLTAMQGFTEGRVGRCVICGKPFIAARERGNLRKYCSGACNKWAQRHDGQPRTAKPAH